MPTLEMTTTDPRPVAENIQLSATTTAGMRDSQTSLIDWCRRKILAERADAEELRLAFESARSKKWKTSTLQRHAALAVKRVQYYEKILAALEAGFVIVPNFPVSLFAIRTERGKPLAYASTQHWDTHEQKPQALAIGEGNYQNPRPYVTQQSMPTEKDPGQKLYQAEAWEPLDFPINMARPHIMEATDRAMALKIFDEFGVLPSPYKKADPLIVGRIKVPGAPAYEKDAVITFMVAWFLDVRQL